MIYLPRRNVILLAKTISALELQSWLIIAPQKNDALLLDRILYLKFLCELEAFGNFSQVFF